MDLSGDAIRLKHLALPAWDCLVVPLLVSPGRVGVVVPQPLTARVLEALYVIEWSCLLLCVSGGQGQIQPCGHSALNYIMHSPV